MQDQHRMDLLTLPDHGSRFMQLKADVDLQPIQMHGYWVNAVSTNDVEYLELEWQDSSQFKGKFRVFPVSGVFKVRIPIVEMGTNLRIAPNIQMTQFPVVINHATTGHKLQGKSMDALVIAEWSKVKKLGLCCSIKGPFTCRTVPNEPNTSRF